MSDSPNTSVAPAPARPRRRRRIVLLSALGDALLVVTATALYLYQGGESDAALQEALAEADRLDPGWRLPELEAARQRVPPGQNAAMLTTRIFGTGVAVLNTGTVREDLHVISAKLDKLPPHVAPDARQTAALRDALKPLDAVLVEARKIADLPAGRFPFNTSPAVFESARHIDSVSITTWLLSSDARLRIQDGDTEGAWESCQAILNAAHALGDEPTQTAQMSRLAHVLEAVRLMERTLAHGVVPEPALAATQKRLAEERRHPALLLSLRGIRASYHHWFTEMEAGRASVAQAKLLATGSGSPPGALQELTGILSRHELKPAHAWLIRYTTRAVEIARQPAKDPEQELQQLAGTRADAPDLARKLAPTFGKWLNPKEHRAPVACAVAALAAERYRLAHDRWPADLADLVAARLLPEVPDDPYDGKPVRYRATKDGVVIHSVGPGGDYTGDALDAAPFDADAERPEFRLWDAGLRGPRP
jgi:hypothetical protein